MTKDSAMVGLGASTPRPWVTYSFLGFGLILVQIFLVHTLFPEVFGGKLIDPDSYTRMVRVAQLHESGAWFDSMILRMNAPYGLSLHWTRSLDILLLFGSLLLSPFLGFQGGLLWSGIFISPALMVICCLAASWAVGPIIGARGRPMIMFLLVGQPIITSYALAGRADHHVLLALTYVLSLGCLFRLISQPGLRWPALAGGAFAGLGLWTSIEFLLPLVTLYASLTVLWLVGFPRTARGSFLFSAGLAAAVALALLVEHPPSLLFSPEYDRISAPHMLVATLAVGFWWLVQLAEGRRSTLGSPRYRVFFLVAGAAAGLGILALTFPRFFSNPMTNLDPEFGTLFLRHIEELQPLFPKDLSGVGRMVIFIGGAVLAIPFALWMLLPLHRRETRAAWLPVAIGLCAFVPLGLYQVRYGLWAGIPIAIALGGILFRVFRRLDGIRNENLGALFRATVAFGIIVGPLFLGGSFSVLWGGESAPTPLSEEASCSVRELASALSEGVYGEVPQTLVAGPNIGPELVYRTHHSVVAAPYHRNPDGLLDTFEMLASTDEAVSRRLMSLRGVDLVILCPDQDSAFFQQVDASDQSLFTQLVNGNGPSWLQSVELPELSKSRYLVFAVNKE